MKKLIIILITIVLISCKSSNQCLVKIKDYKTLMSFKYDTLTFLQKSILDRKSYYVDKSLNQLLNDLYFPISKYSDMIKHSNRKGSVGLNLYIPESILKKSSIKISVIWKEPLSKSIVDSLLKESNSKWIPVVNEFYENKIISNFSITNDSNSLININCIPETKYTRYQPLKKFKGDTLAFIQNSILNRLNFYENKPIEDLVKDIEIPIEKYYRIYSVSADYNFSGNGLQLRLPYLLDKDPDKKLISITYDGLDPCKDLKSNIWGEEVYKKYKDKKIKKITITDLIKIDISN